MATTGTAANGDMLVTLVSSEGEKFELPRKIAEMSELVKGMIQEPGDDGKTEEVNLPDVKATVLSKIIEFMRHHVENRLPEIEKPLKSNDFSQIVPPWDAEYVAIDQEALFDLILAANYMDVKSLLDLCCAKVASLIKGKNAEQIRQQFNIVNDFTKDEEAQIMEENKWCEDL